jgi:hypothetical protein
MPQIPLTFSFSPTLDTLTRPKKTSISTRQTHHRTFGSPSAWLRTAKLENSTVSLATKPDAAGQCKAAKISPERHALLGEHNTHTFRRRSSH